MALIAKTSASGNGVTVTTTAIDTTGANAIILAISAGGGTGSTPTDSKGNTYVGLTQYQNGSFVQIWYCQNPTVGSGHTFTENAGGGSFPAIAVMAWSDMSVSSLYDGQENGAGGTSGATGSITPTVDNCLIVSALTMQDTVDSFAINNGFTVQEHIPLIGGVSYGIGLATLEQGAAAAISATWTAGAMRGAAIASFRTTGGGGGSDFPALSIAL
jgi:hypothetical protein